MVYDQIGNTMNIVAAVLIILSVSFPDPGLDSWLLPIHVVVVNPEGETVDGNELSHAMADVEAALDWWEQLSPIDINSSITSATVITKTADYYQNVVNSNEDMISNDHITIFIINNKTTHTSIYSGYMGISMSEMNAAWIASSMPHQSMIRPLIAHELGHVFFNLEDLNVYDIACTIPDIMCDPLVPYHSTFIGCRSLESMGSPCSKLFLPLVDAGANVGS